MNVTKTMAMGLAGAIALATTFTGTIAEAWEPNKPIDFVIMAGAGGGADQIARFLQSVAEKDGLTTLPLVPTTRAAVPVRKR